MKSLLVAFVALWAIAASAQEYPVKPAKDRRGIRRRRADRRHREDRRPGPHGGARPGVHRREPRGRERHHRHRVRRAFAAGRLHAAVFVAVAAGERDPAREQGQVRPVQGFRADQQRRGAADGGGDQPCHEAWAPCRTWSRSQRRKRRGELRDRRPWRLDAPGRRDAREFHRHEDDQRAVQGQCARACRSDVGKRHVHVLSDHRHRRPRHGEKAQGPRGRHGRAPPGFSRRAHDGRVGFPGVRGDRAVGGHACAGRDARCGREQTQRRNEEVARAARNAGAHEAASARSLWPTARPSTPRSSRKTTSAGRGSSKFRE